MQTRLAMLGTYLHERRSASGLSQRGLAEASGIPRARISHLETGQAAPSIIEIGRMSEALGVDPCAFLQAFGMDTGTIDVTRLPGDLAKSLRELDEHGLELLAYTAAALLLRQSQERD